MIRKGIVAAVALLVLTSVISAQTAARLRWQAGQVLVYRFEQSSRVVETKGETRLITAIQAKATKRWQVLKVDAAGVATLQYSLVNLAYERTMPGGDVLRFDSTQPEKNSPEISKAFNYLGKPLAVLRVDGQGRVVQVVDCQLGSGSQFENELPFLGILPPGELKPGLTWERAYSITLPPPQGVGDKFATLQNYRCDSVTPTTATVTMTTALKAPPEVLADRIPLLVWLPQGELVYDLPTGRLQSGKLKIEQQLKEHQGPGSNYQFESSTLMQYVGDH